MEYIDLINSIVAAEQRAQEIAKEARQKRDSLDLDLSAETAEIRKTYSERTEARIAQAEKAEAKRLQSAVAELDEKLTASLAEVEAAYQANAANWIDSLFAYVTGVSE